VTLGDPRQRGNAGTARRLQVAAQLLEPSISYPEPLDEDLIPQLGEAIDILVSNDFVPEGLGGGRGSWGGGRLLGEEGQELVRPG
jgi:hypothetical protein